MQPKTINIARDFGRYPAGRYAKDGPFSGEEFRNRFLTPALKQADAKTVVEFDGARGLASSFLEEAFGGLVRQGFSPDAVRSHLILQSKDPSVLEEIEEYINEQAALAH